MKVRVLIVLLVSLGALVFAFPGMGSHSTLVEPEVILQAAPGIEDKTPDELTIAERVALASAVSIAQQEQRYIKTATLSSLMFPGAGQLITENYGEAAAFIGVQTLITGATVAGVYLLTPSNLWDLSLTMEQRKANFRDYYNTLTAQEFLPVVGVLTGGMILTSINGKISSSRARIQAEENIASGKVTFEPMVSLATTGGGMTFGMRMRSY
ncbi:MAG: hypothetical protein GW949_09000 [Spirochaetales bacterium]|nr:hypothetical protein [Spirochaetales bacterium]